MNRNTLFGVLLGLGLLVVAGAASADECRGNCGGGRPGGDTEIEVEFYAPADDVEAAANELSRRAESAPRVESHSEIGASPCGDSTGASLQTGVVGGGLATVTEACRAFRLQQLQAADPDSWTTRLATWSHFAGWFPRAVLHFVSGGVLN